MRPIIRLATLAVALLALATPAAAVPPLEDYAQLPSVENVAVSPNGERYAFLAAANGQRALIVRTSPDAPPLLTVGTGSIRVHDIYWIGDNHVAIQFSQTIDSLILEDKIETYQTLVYNVTSKHPMAVFQAARRNIFPITFSYYGYSSKDGQEYGYFDGEPLKTSGPGIVDFQKDVGSLPNVGEARLDLFKVNLETGVTERVAGGSTRDDKAWVLTSDGTIAAESDYTKTTGNWRLYARSEAGPLLAQVTSATDELELLGLGRTPGTVVTVGPDADHDWSYREYQTAAANPGVVILSDKSVHGLIFDPKTRLLIGARDGADYGVVTFFDPALQAKYDRAKRPFAGERTRLVSWSANMDKLVLYTESDQDSGTYFLVDIPARKAEAVGWPYPTIMLADVGATQMISYKAADGLALEGVLTLPPGPSRPRLPLIVLPHGGPESHDVVAFGWWAQALASRGYAVFQPNFRGSTGYGKPFTDAGHGEWGRKMQTDISDGVAELARKGMIDPARVCIVGGSYGGYAALAAVTLQQGLYKCAVSVAGIADLSDFVAWNARGELRDDTSTIRYLRAFTGATSDADPILRTLSPRRLAAKADAPILLIHGRDDTRVPIEQSRSMAAALRAAGKTVEMVELTGADHQLTQAATRIQMLKAVDAFVEKYNPPN